ncbi:nuclear envelope pore membrane protein POM 121 isoform X2 [Brienomyrus brachyistius]|uniref:nuclear envelope pore membrane protein POM 121 isoform X2 n=1 Tax=Brienomyrus brachyistius TaxID=42636 RepID=UPI0020B2D5E7|nr:nuclear envelope pore membrane protein POM 121 isoform X2 [Brienomyrus brachyistius]
MSPREKWWIVFTSLVVFSFAILYLTLYFIPYIFYVVFIFGGICVACFHYIGDSPFHARLGPHPRTSLVIPPVFRRWLPRGTANGVPTPGRVHRDRLNKAIQRDSFLSGGEGRLRSPGDFYRDADTFSDSVVFSPRDIFMGSYLGKQDSPLPAGRASGGGSRELRERLSRPNHAVPTPSRRLSFREPIATTGRFTITPQRHYPLQQVGSPLLGVLPPTRWDGYRKKAVLTPRNSPAAHSPITVKIARPDRARSPLYDPLNSPMSHPLGMSAAADPCARETVLNILKESRKRGVEEDEERVCPSEQKNKRRRSDSGGSSHSAFEPLLANGAPSQLVPKPGSLKRGLNASVMEESLIKRNRTSSMSSQTSSLDPCGVLGSARNPIRSSYSSSQGYPQRKAASSLNFSPLSSPGSSRSQTPERVFKKPREDEALSPSFASSPNSDGIVMDQTAAPGKLTQMPEPPAPITSRDSGGSDGKRKRKVQLVSSRRGDHISLPPPPELGYTVTVKDLDLEKAAALKQIKKVLEEPEPVKPVAPSSVLSFLTPTSNTSPPAPISLLLSSAPAPVCTATPAPTLTLAPASEATSANALNTTPAPAVPGIAPAASSANPLLESLKMMKSSPAPSPAVSSPTGPAVTSAVTSLLAPATGVKAEPSLSAAQPVPTALPPSSLAMSAFAQVLAQPLKPPDTTAATASMTFSLGTPSAATISATVAPGLAIGTSISSSGGNNPLPSAFKPIFGAATSAPTVAVTSTTGAAPASSSAGAPVVSSFKPIFGDPSASFPAFGQPPSSIAPASTAPSSSSSTIISSLSGTVTSAAPVTVKPLFGGWNATPASGTSSSTTTAPATGISFQFGGTPASTASLSLSTTTSTFQFDPATTSTSAPQAAPQPALQGGFTFSQSGNQTATTGSFGGFGVTSVATATTTTTASASGGQSLFTFGKPSFDGPVQTGSAPPAVSKPFPFGGSGPTPFSFGTAASTSTATFGTPSQPAFGGGTSTFQFGGTSAPSGASAFGTVTQPPVPTFTFGGASSAQPGASAAAQPNTGGFGFGAAAPDTQFGAPAPANPTTQTAGFAFGASSAKDSKPAFGNSFGSPSVNFSGTSTPAFGQNATMPFTSPGTQTPGFGALASSPFGASTVAFSIGSCSKPAGARQRLQARRQHPRKK